MIASFDEVFSFVKRKHQEAKEASDEIVFPVEKYAMSGSARAHDPGSIRAEAPSITDVPRFKVLRRSKGLSAWAVILSVDLRHSSDRALRVGAEKTYVTMHTYLPTMAHLVEKAEGKVVGLRGDGLFAAFGVTELKGTSEEVTPEVAGSAAQNAVTCGKGMIEAVEDAINPTLEGGGIDGDLAIGVGVDVGDVVITRIGWETASEVTAYGPPVNRACKKLASKANNSVRISKGVKSIYPSGKGGRVRFSFFSEGFTVDFPKDMFMLRRSSKSLGQKKPR